MRRTPWRAVSLVLVLGLALMACDGPNRGTNTQPSAASGFRLTVTVSPNVLRASLVQGGDGGCAVVTIKVYDTHGNLIDGAVVSVTSTLGVFKLPDDKVGGTLPTTRGTLTVGFCAKNQTGTGIITATAEDAVATTLVTIF